MKWYWYLIFMVLIATGLFSCVKMIDIWNQTSAVYGSISTIETINDMSVVYKHDFAEIMLEKDDFYYNTYKSVVTDKVQDFDGQTSNYTLLFNDILATNVQVSAGQVEGDIAINFYDTLGTMQSTANLHVLIEFLARETRITVVMQNENDSVSYFSVYQQIHGAILKVVQRSN